MMRRMLVKYLVVAALALGTLAGTVPARAEAAFAAPIDAAQAPESLVQTVQYYGYPRYRYYGRPRFYGRGPGYYGYRRVPRFYGRRPGYYGRRGYYR